MSFKLLLRFGTQMLRDGGDRKCFCDRLLMDSNCYVRGCQAIEEFSRAHCLVRQRVKQESKIKPTCVLQHTNTDIGCFPVKNDSIFKH